MKVSPFKGLDAFTHKDYGRFFGREAELTELYNRVLSSKLTLLYGLSGTGKSSLVRCGLANRFSEREWLPVFVRRGSSITEAMSRELYRAWTRAAQRGADASTREVKGTWQDNARRAPRALRRKSTSGNLPDWEAFTEIGSLEQQIERVYYAVYRPVYFIFDQFEELYTINPFTETGRETFDPVARDRWEEEQHEFYGLIGQLLDSEQVSVRIILIVREEWWARMNVFEQYVPELNQNRMRIERMGEREIAEVIRGTINFSQQNAAFRQITLRGTNFNSETVLKEAPTAEDPTTAAIIATVRDARDHSLDLVDLQIYLERLLATFAPDQEAVFTTELVAANQLDNVIDGFLEDRLRAIENKLITRWTAASPTADKGMLTDRARGIPLEVLFRLVTDQGTKRATDEDTILRAPLFRARDITANDLRFCLAQLAEYKVVNSYQL